MQDSRVILDQNGAEELAPPGQAILVRGVETLKVMSPYLPDDERALRLVALRSGETELTNNEKLVLEAANRLIQGGKKVTQRAVVELVRGNMPKNTAENVLRNLRKHGLLAEMSNAEDEA
jgi:hypothetical protein